jgi:hypothetical protein
LIVCGLAGRVSAASFGLWDTGRPAEAPLAGAAFAANGQWKRLPRDQQDWTFRGDAVMSNESVVAVFRRHGSLVEVYSSGPAGVVGRARLQLVAPSGEPAVRLDHLAVVQHGRSAARVEASYATATGDPIVVRFRLKRGDVALELQPMRGAGQLRVICRSRFLVLPDFFADDIVIDAEKMPVPSLELPSENFVLQPLGEQDAIAMCVFENREQDVRVALETEGNQRVISETRIDFGKQSKIWLAILAGPQVWHALEVTADQADRIIPLSWNMPYPAQWRVDFSRPNELTDSWEMLLPRPRSGGYLKPGWLGTDPTPLGPDRKRWTTVLGWFKYPCWIDRTGQGYVQPLKNRTLAFRGPALIYPINRTPATPSDRFTVTDVVRNCLGVGPCEYILDVEGQKQEFKGRATCGARDALKAIYSKGQQAEKQQQIEAALDDALAFVTHIRSRITRYVEFGRALRTYLQQQRREHPELQDFLTEMEGIAEQIDVRVEQRREQIKTPRFVARMNEDFRKQLLHYEGPDAMARLEKYTRALTRIGGNQDELVGECRWVVRTLRQRAGLSAALQPESAEIAEEIRKRCQAALLKPAAYEAARH